MRGIVYQFDSFYALSLVLEAGGDEQDIELPTGVTGFGDGEWVVAQFNVGQEATSVAACVVDRGDGLRLAFEDRDWRQLWKFAERAVPPSIPPPTVPPPSGEVPAPVGIRVLVVDGDAATRHVLTQLLESSSYLVSTVASAEEALERLRDMAIDLVILDSRLPGMNGMDLCRRIRKDPARASTPVLFLTAQSSSDDLVEAFAAGGDDFVAKPFRAPELQARILGLLRRAAMPAHTIG